MLATILVLIAGLLGQDPAHLSVGQTKTGTLEENSYLDHVPSPALGENASQVMGRKFSLRVHEDGPYYIDLHSHDFDTYLVVQSEGGVVIGEDDDGLLGRHSRLAVELNAHQDYLVFLCSIDGNSGSFRISIHRGEAPKWTDAQFLQALLKDGYENIAYYQGKYGQLAKEVGWAHTFLAIQLIDLEEFGLAHGLLEQGVKILTDELGVTDPNLGLVLYRFAESLERVGEYGNAKERYLQVLAIELSGDETPPGEIAITLLDLGRTCSELGDFAESQSFLDRSLAIRKKEYGEASAEVATVLNSLGSCYQDQGRFDDAAASYDRSMATWIHLEGRDSLEYMTVLANKASLEGQTGNLKKARQMFEEVVAFQEGALGPMSNMVAANLSNLAGILKELGEFEQALEYYERAASIQKREFGDRHPTYAIALNNLGNIHSARGEFPLAKDMYERSLSILENQFGRQSYRYRNGLGELAGVLVDLGQYRKAKELYETTLHSRVEQLGRRHPRTATSLGNLAFLLIEIGDFHGARPLVEEALSIRREALGETHSDVARSLNQLGSISVGGGRLTEAQEHYQQALEVWQKAVGDGHPHCAIARNNLAFVLAEQGFWGQARSLHEEALQIIEQALGEKHPDYAWTLNHLGAVLEGMGDEQEAKRLHRKAYQLRTEIFGVGHPAVAESLNNLAGLFVDQMDYENGIHFYQQALEIYRGMGDSKKREISICLSNLGNLYSAMGNPHEARRYLLDSLALRESEFGNRHVQTAYTLNNLGMLELRSGRLGQAERYLTQALDIEIMALGEPNPIVCNTLNNLGILYREQGEGEREIEFRRRALSGILQHLEAELPTMSEAERLMLLGRVADPEDFLECLSRGRASDLSEPYSLFRRWKGAAKRLQSANKLLLSSTSEGSLQKGLSELHAIAAELSRLVLLPQSQWQEGHEERLRLLKEERLSLERSMNRKMNLEDILHPLGLTEFQNQIADNSVFIDFFVGEMVYAWILKSKGKPQLVSLGASLEIRQAHEEYLQRTAVRGGRSLDPDGPNPGAGLFHLLWKPLAESVKGCEVVVICPDRFLCELPFGILPTGHGRYLIESHRFQYLDEPSIPTMTMADHGDVDGPILAVGNVNYFRRREAPAKQSNAGSPRSRIGESWISLPKTAIELQSLQDLHDHILDWSTPITVIEGADATEERVRVELLGKRYIHLATHGFFEPDYLPSLLADAEKHKAKPRIDEQIKATGYLPGLLSGLVFAGVNGDPEPGSHDGYLFAEEIQHLDLSSCELVVLSACETALGSARSGEGLMSMRRAFSVAGAKTVVSSLWKVDDRATAQLMKDFYSNLWEQKMGKAEALHQARINMLRRNRIENGGKALPDTWGAFVLSGAWNRTKP